MSQCDERLYSTKNVDKYPVWGLHIVLSEMAILMKVHKQHLVTFISVTYTRDVYLSRRVSELKVQLSTCDLQSQIRSVGIDINTRPLAHEKEKKKTHLNPLLKQKP